MRMMMAALMCAAAACAQAATTMELVTEGDVTRYVVTVPDSETYTLTESDAASFGTTDILKTGGGTLVAGAAMTNYVGDIFITNGVYRADAAGACGPNAGKVVVSGTGTLMNGIASGNDWSSSGGYPSLELLRRSISKGPVTTVRARSSTIR